MSAAVNPEDPDLNPVGRYVAPFTVAVAACSIVYELIYSQALTVAYGQTVARYSMTIGLYLMSLGLGAFLFARRAWSRLRRRFFAVEVSLSILGPAGVFIIFLMPGHGMLSLVASHVPVVVVGLLSGIELPILASLASSRQRSVFEVLGWDYVGSLVGTVVYGLWLYPKHGLIAAALGVGALNALVAAVFAGAFGPRRPMVRVGSAALAGLSLAVLFGAPRAQDRFSRWYAERLIRERFEQVSSHLESLDVLAVEQTPYQEIWRYDLHWSFGTERCLDLDGQLQYCASWAEEYHHGLIDVPLALFEAERPMRVLLIGGGDFIPMRFLARYGNVVQVDQVDIDPEFMAYAKRDPMLRELHRDAYRDPRLNVVVADAFEFVQKSRARYDLVLLDLPGLHHDKSLPLYSTEFYQALVSSLAHDGLIVTWMYAAARHPRHTQVLMQTWHEAGLTHYTRYRAYSDASRNTTPVALFAVLSRGVTPQLRDSKRPYVERWGAFYSDLDWRRLPNNPEISANSVFRPNHALLTRPR